MVLNFQVTPGIGTQLLEINVCLMPFLFEFGVIS